MPHKHRRQRYRPPAPRAPRVPPGEKIVAEGAWLTSDHPAARWYRVVEEGRGQVRVQVADDAEGTNATAATVAVARDGRLTLPASLAADPEALRIVATALREYRRRAGEP